MVEMPKLIRLHNVLVAIRVSQAHPRMDTHTQMAEDLNRLMAVIDKETLRELREKA